VYPGNGKWDPAPFSLSLFLDSWFTMHSWLMLCRLTMGSKWWSQPARDWNLQNCDPKQTFPLYKLSALGICHWGMTHASVCKWHPTALHAL
jgi:hypothetical protein